MFENRVFKWQPPNFVQQFVTGTIPAGRFGAQVVFAPGPDVFVSFGGELAGGVTTLETWTWRPESDIP